MTVRQASLIGHVDQGRAGLGQIDVQPLTPERFADLAELFNEGGDPKWCWCMYFRTRGMDWTNSSPEVNRTGLRALAEREIAPGLVGYRNGRAVAWVSLSPREAYGRLEASRVFTRVDDTPVWSIVCFVVSRRARGQGVAAAMLTAAITYARDHGATMLEAYPVAAEAGRVSADAAYKGVQSTFERAGFKVVAMRHSKRSTPPERPIMRLALI